MNSANAEFRRGYTHIGGISAPHVSAFKMVPIKVAKVPAFYFVYAPQVLLSANCSTAECVVQGKWFTWKFGEVLVKSDKENK